MKKKENKIKTQTFMQGVFSIMISQIIIKIIGLIYKLYLTNRDGFGDSGNAIYSSGYYIYAMLLTISSLGVPSAIAKLVAEKIAVGDIRAGNRIFKISFFVFAFIGLIGTLILYLGSEFIANVILEIPESKYTIMALSPAIFFVSITAVFRGYFNGREDLKASANSQSLEQFLKTFITIFLVEIISTLSGTNTLFMAAGANLATTLATFFSFIYILAYYKRRKKYWNKKTKILKKDSLDSIRNIVKKILYTAVPTALTSLMASINKNIDSITVVRNLKKFLPEAEALKQYGKLGGKIDALIVLPLGLNAGFAVALVPAIASAIAKGENKIACDKVSFSLLITILIALPCTAGIYILASPILNLLFPNANDGSVLLQISAFSILFTMLSQTIISVLQGIGKAFLPAIAFLIGVIIKFTLNIILIPNQKIGINGAALSTVISNAVICIISWIMLKKYIKINIKFTKYFLKPIIATFIMAICTYFTYLNLYVILSRKLATIISIFIAIIIYIVAIMALKVFNENDFKLLPYGEKIYKILLKFGLYKAHI